MIIKPLKPEYVIYLSKSKVDMLFDQIHTTTGETTIETKVDVKVASVKVEKKTEDNPNYYEKLEIVTKHIQDEVGSVFDAELPSYISDTFLLNWQIWMASSATHWVGVDNDHRIKVHLLLIGSEKNILGGSTANEGFIRSDILRFLDAYSKEFELDMRHGNTGINKQCTKKDIPYIVDELYRCSMNSILDESEYRYLAKCLFHQSCKDRDGSEIRYVVASPLYVYSEK